MEEIKKELNAEELEEASGGSIFNREDSIRGAGIELWKEYNSVPGEFGIFHNSGDYYFKGQKIDQDQIDALEQYRKKKGEIAPDLQTAVDYANSLKKHAHKFLH